MSAFFDNTSRLREPWGMPKAELLRQGLEGLVPTFPPINGNAAGGLPPTGVGAFYASTMIPAVV